MTIVYRKTNFDVAMQMNQAKTSCEHVSVCPDIENSDVATSLGAQIASDPDSAFA